MSESTPAPEPVPAPAPKRSLYYMTLSDPESYLLGKVDVLKRSMERFGHELHVIQQYQQGLGNYNKILGLLNYLRSPECVAAADDDIIVFMDAFDVICVKPMGDEFEAGFRARGVDIVFGAENLFSFIYPEAKVTYDRLYGRAKFKYLNSGFVMGYKRAVIQFYGFISRNLFTYPRPDGRFSDQRLVGLVFHQNKSPNYPFLKNLKLDLDFRADYILTKNWTVPLDQICFCNAYFIHVTGMGEAKQSLAYNFIRRLSNV